MAKSVDIQEAQHEGPLCFYGGCSYQTWGKAREVHKVGLQAMVVEDSLLLDLILDGGISQAD